MKLHNFFKYFFCHIKIVTKNLIYYSNKVILCHNLNFGIDMYRVFKFIVYFILLNHVIVHFTLT